jgi:hypothetical protein
MTLNLVGRAVTTAALVLTLTAGNLHAQDEVIGSRTQVAFDQPEAWAMKYFTSMTLLNGLDVHEPLPPGSIQIGAEIGWLPRLSTVQQRVGFFGSAPQDLNKAPFFVRPRVTIALPGRFSFTAAGVPPVRSFGITPRLAAVSLAHPIYDRDGLMIGWRAGGQVGTVTGSFTCGPAMVAAGLDTPANPEGCVAPSSDTATLRYGGVAIDISRRAGRAWTPHASVGVNYMSTVYQINAVTDEYIDHNRLDTHGLTVAASAGIGYAMTKRLTVAADVFYSPLTVRRRFDAPRSIDGALNARALVLYRLR